MVCTLVVSRGCIDADSAIRWQSHRACALLPTLEGVCHAEKRTENCPLFVRLKTQSKPKCAAAIPAPSEEA